MKGSRVKSLFLFYLIIVFAGYFSCSSSEAPKQLNNDATIKDVVAPDFTLPYHLNAPESVHYLDRELIEISGLSLAADTSELVGINDELGRIYFLEKMTGEILSSFEFATPGDYEGIEHVNGKYYIVKNNGTIYIFDPATQEVGIENTFLTSANNVEGLSYWPKRNRVLLACKGSASGKHKYKKAKAIYDFDLEEMKLKKKPMFLITTEATKDFLAASNASGITQKILKEFQINDALNFAPSGIAVHPKTQDIYLLSANGRTLFVVDEKGNIQHIEFLNKSKFYKPEGITFDLDGTLYISNEGKNAKANIMKFEVLN